MLLNDFKTDMIPASSSYDKGNLEFEVSLCYIVQVKHSYKQDLKKNKTTLFYMNSHQNENVFYLRTVACMSLMAWENTVGALQPGICRDTQTFTEKSVFSLNHYFQDSND